MKRRGIRLKVKVKIVRALDKAWLKLRSAICDAECWIVTYDYLITDIQKEITKKGLRVLKR